jgi:hypothetical protein
MARSNASTDRENAEFAELALESLREGVRRAFIDHERCGFLVTGLRRGEIEWVSPREKLSLYPAPAQTLIETQDAEQGAEQDI